MKRMVVLAVVLGALLTVATFVSASEKTVLHVWSEWGGAQASFDEIVALYEAKHPNIEIQWQIVGLTRTDGQEKLLTNMMAGTAPDLVTLTTTWVPFGEKNLLQPLDSYISRSGVDWRSNYHPTIWNTNTLNGKVYGIPAFEGGPGHVMFYNKEQFGETGIPEPGNNRALTWDEFGQIARKLARQDSSGKWERIGFWPKEANGNRLGRIASTYNTTWMNLETGLGQIDSPTFASALRMIKENFYDPFGYENVMEIYRANTAWMGHSVKGITGMYLAGYWGDSSGEKGVTWTPTFDGARIQDVTGWAVFMTADSKNKDEAWELLQFLASPEATQVVYRNHGWLGGMNRDLPRYLDLSSKPGTVWLLQSIDAADRVPVEPLSSYTALADKLWKEAYEKVVSGAEPAPSALAEANQKLNAQILEDRARD